MAKSVPSSAARAQGSVDVMTALRTLLASRDDAAVLELVAKLMSTHERQLRSLLESMRQKGAKNEGVRTAQLALLFDELARRGEMTTTNADEKLKQAARGDGEKTPPAAADTKPRKPPAGRRPLPPHLPRVHNVIKVPDAERECPRCGKERACVGHEESAVIEIEPARAFVRVDQREKLAPCASCVDDVMVTAPLGDKVIPGGAYGPRLCADILAGKFEYGLPLYRQHERYEHLGLDIPTSTMGDQVTWMCELLTPIWRRLLDETLASDTMHLDGTSLPVLDRDSPLGIKQGTLWGYVGMNRVVENNAARDDARAVYLYTSTGRRVGQREGELGPEDVLEMRRARNKPHVVADAAGLFDAAFAKPGLVACGCNMHGRRYFVKALEAGDARAALPIAAFKKLYDVEDRIRSDVPDVRLAIRQRDSQPVYDELLAWAESYRASEPRSSLLGKAVRYLGNHRVALTRFLDDGSLPIDNGVTERMHRRAAIGRRNYLFAGSDAGAQRAAIAYSVFGTCRLAGVNPVDYLADVLPRLARGIAIARDLPALMPAAYANAR